MFELKEAKLGIVGLGYVGLPLAVEFGKIYNTVGFDINQHRIDELKNGTDSTLEVDSQELNEAKQLSYTTNTDDLKDCNVFIVTVPTPIDNFKRPDLSPLMGASKMVGQVIGKGDVVVFESTVYPGATEEVCTPIIEQESGRHFDPDVVEAFFEIYDVILAIREKFQDSADRSLRPSVTAVRPF